MVDDLTEWQGFSKPERVAPLPTLPLAKGGEASVGRSEGRIRIGELVGEGGIGRVYAAEQVTIGRRVAVKYPRLEDGVLTRTSLLSEAWAAGTLDHPNVVRVHALGLDDDGNPMVVMQYIEGSPWTDLMCDPNHPMWALHLAEASAGEAASSDGETTPEIRLADQIRILMQVASAVQHAHNHQILHRDLKSDNVMIGELGKIAIIDWGTAVSLVEAPESRLVFHEDIDGVTGTPACMAPEMATGDGKLLSEATDVYLMGGMLYELLAGVQPHHAPDPVSALLLASKGHVPDFPPEAPRVLVEICRKALSPDPEDRHRSAAEFRTDLMRYMRQRSARRSLADAQRATSALAELVGSSGQGSPHDSGAGDQPYQVHRAYTRAELGYQQALTTNVDRASIDIGIEQCRLLMTRYALAAGDLDQAAVLLQRVQKPPPELCEELERRQQTGQALEEALDSIETDENASRRRSGQLLAGLMSGLVAGLVVVGAGLAEQLELVSLGHLHYASLMAVTVVGLVLLLAARSKALVPRNRRLLVGLVVALVVASSTWPIGDAFGASVHGILVVLCLEAAFFLAVLAALVQPILAWGAIAALGFYAAAAALPQLADFWAAGTIAVAVAAVVVGWQPTKNAKPRVGGV